MRFQSRRTPPPIPHTAEDYLNQRLAEESYHLHSRINELDEHLDARIGRMERRIELLMSRLGMALLCILSIAFNVGPDGLYKLIRVAGFGG